MLVSVVKTKVAFPECARTTPSAVKTNIAQVEQRRRSASVLESTVTTSACSCQIANILFLFSHDHAVEMARYWDLIELWILNRHPA